MYSFVLLYNYKRKSKNKGHERYVRIVQTTYDRLQDLKKKQSHGHLVCLHQDVYKFYVNPLLYRSTTYPSVTLKIYSPFYLHTKVYLIIEFYSNTLSICMNISWKNFNIYQLKIMLNVWAM